VFKNVKAIAKAAVLRLVLDVVPYYRHVYTPARLLDVRTDTSKFGRWGSWSLTDFSSHEHDSSLVSKAYACGQLPGGTVASDLHPPCHWNEAPGRAKRDPDNVGLCNNTPMDSYRGVQQHGENRHGHERGEWIWGFESPSALTQYDSATSEQELDRMRTRATSCPLPRSNGET
jgi:hypothetical protein